ncbi:MAG: ribosomal L7Ae/L30e/S12e/Gadd45 family protein [Ruminococcus sp.]|nr:ribosomal L7Ae/L30e/S12e/Gadd45 family protein [Ruminococcus sp.]
MNDKILNLLGLCRRAGRLTVGNDAVADDVLNGNAKLVLVSSDISLNTEKKLNKVCTFANTELLKLNRTRDELSDALGRFCAVVGVCDDGFAKKLVWLIQNETGGKCL